MNRKEEYQELMIELEKEVPEIVDTLERARKRRNDMIYRPLIGIAAAFTVFVFLVNFSMPVAYACSQIPGLRELAEAVTFSRSLSDAVDNEYVQTMNLIQRDGEVSAKIEYLIVDQKQVNVFYRLYSDVYQEISAEPTVCLADGSGSPSCSWMVNDYDLANGELRSLTIDFVEDDVPDSLKIYLDIRDDSIFSEEGEEATEADLFHPEGTEEEEYIAHFEFLLEFDPEFTATGKEIAVNKTVELEGQKIKIEEIAIYPTHMRINISDDSENTAWLRALYFYIETDWGMKFEPVAQGITATGSGETNTMASFRADSTYFYNAKNLKIVITGAEWLDKDMEKVYVNLETGETGELPEGVEFYSAEEKASGWILQFKAVQRKEGHHHQLMLSTYYDMKGNEYSINSWSTGENVLNNNDSEKYFIEELFLTDYHEKELFVSPNYSNVWTAETPIEVEVK